MSEIQGGNDGGEEAEVPAVIASYLVVGPVDKVWQCSRKEVHDFVGFTDRLPSCEGMEVIHAKWEIDVTINQEEIVQDKDVDALFDALLRLVGERSFITLNLHTQRVRHISRRALEKLQSLGKELEKRKCRLYVSHWNRASVES